MSGSETTVKVKPAKKPKPIKIGHSRLERRRNMMGYWFIVPFLVGLVIFIPSLVEAIMYGFTTINITDTGYNLVWNNYQEYEQIFKRDPDFIRGIFESVGTMLLNVLIILIYALLIATVLNRHIAGKGVYRAILFLPVIIATGIISTVDNTVLVGSITGGANQAVQTGAVAGGIFDTFDLESLIYSLNISPAFTDIVVGAAENVYTIITSSGVQLIIFLAGLQSISPSVYESATVEGATWWESFWKITIPMISPLILVNMVYTVVDSFTRAGNEVMDKIYEYIITSAQYSTASARSVVYLLVVGVILALVVGITSRFVFYENK